MNTPNCTGRMVKNLDCLYPIEVAGRNEMDPPLCGSTSMSHNEFKKIIEPIEPQEASPMKHEMHVVWSKYSNSPFHERLRFYHRRCFGLSSASLLPILSVKRDGNG